MVTTMKKYLFTIMVAVLISGCLHKEEPKDPAPSADHMINGQVPPMTPTRAAEQSIALEVIDDDRELLTEKTVRSVGTRAPIHLHPYGGQTCILSGEMTLYMDGSEPARAVAGNCYFMPSGHRMTGVNSGNTDAVMFDSFVIPTGSDVWTIVEPGFDSSSELLSSVRKPK